MKLLIDIDVDKSETNQKKNFKRKLTKVNC